MEKTTRTNIFFTRLMTRAGIMSHIIGLLINQASRYKVNNVICVNQFHLNLLVSDSFDNIAIYFTNLWL